MGDSFAFEELPTPNCLGFMSVILICFRVRGAPCPLPRFFEHLISFRFPAVNVSLILIQAVNLQTVEYFSIIISYSFWSIITFSFQNCFFHQTYNTSGKQTRMSYYRKCYSNMNIRVVFLFCPPQSSAKSWTHPIFGYKTKKSCILRQ